MKTNILPDECILLVQYIFAVIVLTKYQRPGVILGEVLNSQVSAYYTCISVKEHKTGTEIKLIESYTKVRATSNKPTFFLRISGNKLTHVGKEINRLQTKYKYKTFTSSDVRKAIETVASKSYSETDPRREIL